MTIYVRPRRRVPSSGKPGDAYLEEDGWNDYGYYTLFGLHVVDAAGAVVNVGGVRIGSTDMGDSGKVVLPNSFDTLESKYFSLGTDGDYYESLTEFGGDFRNAILAALRDLAASPQRLHEVLDLDVVQKSLLRSTSAVTVEGEFYRLARGLPRLLRYEFSYSAPNLQVEGEVKMNFAVDPESRPPSNIHALIGSNGVGKTSMLEQMVRSLVDHEHSPDGGKLELSDGSTAFAGVVRVSFSAFDEIDPSPLYANRREPRLEYVGLRSQSRGVVALRSLDQLASQFGESVTECLSGRASSRRWSAAVEELEADPLIRDVDLGRLVGLGDRERRAEAEQIFLTLSSGHKIVLLTTARLVELVEERTLVLLDEPESHLHPPLLSAFAGALGGLLSDTNGVAIAATHSPVLLQEIPRSCAWIVRRVRDNLTVRRPTKETFGENVGDLTHDVFRLEVTSTGFYERLAREARDCSTYRELLQRFDGKLGTEGRALARSLITDQDF